MVPHMICHCHFEFREHTVKKRAPTCNDTYNGTGWLVVGSCCGRWKLRHANTWRHLSCFCKMWTITVHVSSHAALRFALVRQRVVSRGVGVGDCRRVCVPVHHSTVSGVATCCGYSTMQQNTRAHTGALISSDGEGDGGRGEDEVEDFCGSVPRGMLTWVYAWKRWSSSYLSRKAHHILLL